MSVRPSASALRILRSLQARGLMLVQDAHLPSVVAELVGAPIKGSWWSHPRSHEIYSVLDALGEHEDVCVAPLLNAKQTLITRALFPALVAVGSAREAWQLRSLSAQAQALLARVDHEAQLLASGDDARTLERALLVASREVHTDTGAHRKQLLTWERFASERGVAPYPASVQAAKREFERAAAALDPNGAGFKLPWPPS